tara:strand:+ start:15 stop:485 length:471 start_codon:yes stop_codon:yes gene_type:complete
MKSVFNLKKYLAEGKMLKEEQENESKETFSTPEELADFLNKHKEEFFNEFKEDVIMYVIDAFGPFESGDEEADQEWFEGNFGQDNIKNFIKEQWMKPEMRFKVEDYDTGEGVSPIVSISWPGSDTDVDMSGYGWFQNTPGDKTVNFLGRKFFNDYN